MYLPKALFISGKKLSGKDTFATILAKKLYLKAHVDSVQIFAFAEPVKEAAKKIFLLTDDQMYDQSLKEVIDPRWGMSPREIMQKLGTEVGRQIHKDVWVLSTLYRFEEFVKNSRNLAIVPDCRFPNEIEVPREKLGSSAFYIRIIRDLPENEYSNHASEIALDAFEDWDRVVYNNGTLEDLEQQADEIIRDWESVHVSF